MWHKEGKGRIPGNGDMDIDNNFNLQINHIMIFKMDVLIYYVTIHSSLLHPKTKSQASYKKKSRSNQIYNMKLENYP
jgi:hypothetical protein